MDLRRLIFLAAVSCIVLGASGEEGFATYYGEINYPACGYGDPHSWFKAGWTSDGMVQGKIFTTAMNSDAYNDGMNCGACYEVKCLSGDASWGGGPNACTGKSVIVTCTDLCPAASNSQWCSNDHTHFDMTPEAWDVIGNNRANGWLKVSYQRVDCDAQGGITMLLRGASHANWQSFAPLYVEGPGTTTAMQVSDDGGSSWKNCNHQWGAHWTHDGELSNGPLSIRLTTGNGQTVTMINVISGGWQGKGGYYSSNANYGGSAGGNVVNRRRRPSPRPKGMRKRRGGHCVCRAGRCRISRGRNKGKPCGVRRRRNGVRH